MVVIVIVVPARVLVLRAVFVTSILVVMPITRFVAPFATLIARDVLALVPVIAYEIDGPTAGIVFGAVPRPILFMTGRHMQINRGLDITGHVRDCDRLCVDERGRLRDTADVEPKNEQGHNNPRDPHQEQPAPMQPRVWFSVG